MATKAPTAAARASATSARRPAQRKKPEAATRVARICDGLGHPVRVRSLHALAEGKASPSRLVSLLGGDVPLGVISYHLRTLLKAGLIRKAGTRSNRGAIEHFYMLSPVGEAILPIVDELQRIQSPTSGGERRRRISRPRVASST